MVYGSPRCPRHRVSQGRLLSAAVGDRDSFSGAPGTAQPSEAVAVRGRAWSFRSAGAAHATAGVLGAAGGWELIICGYLTTALPR